MRRSEADKSQSAFLDAQNVPEDTRGVSAGSPQTSRDIALRSPPIREAQSAIGVFRNALGTCKRGAREEKAGHAEEQRKQETINMH